ncbi:MAG TPA: head GIN domain-containing protein [Bacteroidota bacterium]|nr:head GIN domain-containing protein [Bacteroidota bacterium]
MKKIFIASVICLISLCSCFGPRVRGNGTIKTEPRELPSFESIVCDGGYDIQITCGSSQSVALETDENLLPFIRTVVRGNELHIDTKKNLSSTSGIKIIISVPQLTAFTADGSSKGYIYNIHSDAFQFTGNGSAHVVLSGTAEKTKIVVNGSGDIEADSLVTQDATIRIEGSGDIRCHVLSSLDARIDGSGSIKYLGEPKHVEQSIHGSGSIRKAE